jgi:YrbI family 3-deoxy-D-manno-octulosonate 8-phosphate phosphatase
MNKISFMDQIAEKMDINFDQIAFIGDHWIDMPVLKKVNLSFCPIDAIEEVKKICKYHSVKKGGEGVLEDFVFQFFKDKYSQHI